MGPPNLAYWVTNFVGGNNRITQKPDQGSKLPLSGGTGSLGNSVCLGLLGDGDSSHLNLAFDWCPPVSAASLHNTPTQASASGGAGALASKTVA